MKLLSGEAPVIGGISVVGLLQCLHNWLSAHQGDLSALVSIGQIIVIGFTVYHLAQKQWKLHREKKANRNRPPEPDSP